MERRLALVVAIATLIIAAQSAQAQRPAAKLSVVSTFRTGGAEDWDYPVLDPETHRLYIACDDHVQVVDTKRGTKIGDIVDVHGAHGIAFAPGKNLGFITSGDDNAVVTFDPKTLKITHKISMPKGGGDNPDPIIYDPASRKVFALCEGGDAVAIDPENLDAPPTPIECGGPLEYGRADGAGKIFVNNEEKSEIEVIDTKALKLVDHWPLAPLEAPSGLAIDLEHHRLFAVGENQKMAIVDYNNGKLLATVDIGEGADGCAFDPKLKVAVSPNGDDGTLSVVRETSPGKFTAVQTLNTAKSARTITDDPSMGRFYIPATVPAKGGGAEQFGILVVGPAL